MRKFLTALSFILLSTTVDAEVKLPPIFGDNMVLQQKSDAALWGSSRPGATVVISPSWSASKIKVKTDAEGKWFTRVVTPASGGPYELTFDDGELLTLTNVMIGEVWICSGQSNMEMPLRGFVNQPVKGAAEYIATAVPSVPIRYCKLKKVSSLEPQPECEAKWCEHTSESLPELSAVAYFFAQMINRSQGVPVGLIVAAWGGSTIEAWMEKSIIEKDFAGELDLSAYKVGVLPEKYSYRLPGTLYNGMLNSVIPYTAKGFLWYHGEQNKERAEQYTRLQPAFVKMLREKWGDEKMPFYFTQIAPYGYRDPMVGGTFMYAQSRTLKTIPNSGMACICDLGDQYCIHPSDKKEVGYRLAYFALANDYGVKGLEPQGPLYKDVTFSQGKAIVSFEVGPLGLSPINRNLSGFEVAGKDKVFYPAEAKIGKDGKTVIAQSPEVPEPVYVRYGINGYCTASLFNNSGIPASPFKTYSF